MTLPANDNPQNTSKKAVDFGPQPLCLIMDEHKLTPKDLVNASSAQLTFKVVKKAQKGRRLTLNSKQKVCQALNEATQLEYSLKDLFNYSD